jgi:DNA processing protein
MNINIMSLYISRIPRISTKERLLLSDLFSSVKELVKLGSKEIEEIFHRKIPGFNYDSTVLEKETELIYRDLFYSDIDILNYWENTYPPLLREIFNPPYLLYKKGERINNSFSSIAVIGTRDASVVGKTAAYNLGLEIADTDTYLVSGLASGIDREAHSGVVNRKGSTIAVLGNGIDYIYPSENKDLGRRIIEIGGTIISEYPPGTPPSRYNFPARNRIISGICRSVVIVEAPKKSGALITAEFALEQGRDVYIHNCSINSTRGEGCRKLLFEGAGIINSLGDLVRYREAV